MAEPKKIKTRIINKHATAAVWEATQDKFTPLEGELIVYDKDNTYSAPRLKIGTGSKNVNELNFISEGMVDNSSLTCDNNTGKISLSEQYKTYLDNQLYQPPTISAFNIVGSNAEVTNTAISISSFTHTETNVGNINGTLTLKRGSTTVKSGISPSASSASVTISDSYTPSTAQTVTYTLSGVNTKGTAFSKTDSVTYYCPHYYGALSVDKLTAGSNITSLGLTKHSFTGTNWTGTISVETAANDYVYFVTTDNSVTFKSGGFDVTTTKTTQSFTVNGTTQTYYVYRTNKLAAGSNTFVLS